MKNVSHAITTTRLFTIFAAALMTVGRVNAVAIPAVPYFLKETFNWVLCLGVSNHVQYHHIQVYTQRFLITLIGLRRIVIHVFELFNYGHLKIKTW